MFLTALVVLQTAAAAAVQTGEFASPRLRESSGVAVSRAHPDVLWTHNDSGDGPYLYATDLRGRDRGFLLVPGADAVDWEDIALGPCPTRAGSCVYLADTGDNLEMRASVTVYAVPEPTPPTGPEDTLGVTAAPAVLHLRYADGPHDVEAIFVSPRDGTLYFVSKGRSGGIRLYSIPRGGWLEQGIVTAGLVQALDIQPQPEAGRMVTGAAMSFDALAVAVRTYTEIYLFTPLASGRLVPSHERPCDIAGLEQQGEAIAFLDDSTLVVTSEAAGRRLGTIHTVVCPRS